MTGERTASTASRGWWRRDTATRVVRRPTPRRWYIGFFDPADANDDHCIVTIGGDADWVARYLVSLPMPFDVLESEDVRAEIRAIAYGLIARHGGAQDDCDAI